MIQNFATVEVGIYRGGQPDAEGWAFLKSIDITQVIKLNEDSEAVDNVPDGMELFEVEIPFIEQLLTEPVMSDLLTAVEFIAKGTFIHCKHCQDRTGLLIGMWRVLKCDWSKHRAYAEMLEHGYHPILLGLDKAWCDLN